MNLGVLPEQGGSLTNLAAAGQDRRFIDQYLRRYADAFERVYYFSYAAENAALPDGCELIPNRMRLHRWVYAVLLPLIHARRFRACDVIRVMQLTGELPALLAKFFYKVPFAATYGYRYAENARSDGEGRLRAALFALRTRIALRVADRIIVTNPVLREEVIARLGPDKVVLLPNGVDVTEFTPAANPCSVRRATLLAVGRLSPVKNLFLLIDAAAQLEDQVTVRLIGAGPLRDSLAEHALQCGVRLELPGTIEHRRLPDELRQAAVFVLTSHREGHPKALLEAMSCGAVCVGTRSPGILELLEHEVTGLLCRSDATELAATLRRALHDDALRDRLARQARARIERDFDIEVLLQREVSMLKALAATTHAC